MCVYSLPSVLWRCWLRGRKGIRPVKNWAVGCWHGYLPGERCRLASQLMPLPLTVSCFRKIQIGFIFLVPAHPGSTGQRAVKRARVCVYSGRSWQTRACRWVLACPASPSSPSTTTITLPPRRHRVAPSSAVVAASARGPGRRGPTPTRRVVGRWPGRGWCSVGVSTGSCREAPASSAVWRTHWPVTARSATSPSTRSSRAPSHAARAIVARITALL